jgi:Tfp pilus assembly protein PilX
MRPNKQSQILDLKSQIRTRRGAVLVSVLVCLLVVVLLLGLLVQSIIARQRQMRAEEQRSQAEWLADSAVERGAAKLRMDAEFEKETWNAAAEELGGPKGGVAEIRSERVEGSPQRRKLVVEAIYPDDPHRRARATREVFIDLGDNGGSS